MTITIHSTRSKPRIKEKVFIVEKGKTKLAGRVVSVKGKRVTYR